jgi:ABC-type branched-subunit amino acid transport system substrate-binding protein
MRKLIAIHYLIAFVLISVRVCYAESQPTPSAPRPLALGIILPLSGKAATMGNAIYNGSQLALKSLPPTIRSKLDVYYEDDGSESKNTVSAFQKLRAEHKIDVVVSALSNAGNAIVPLSEQAGVTLIAIAVDRNISKDKHHAVTIWASLNDLAEEAVKEAKRRGYKKVAMVTTSHEGNVAMRSAFLAAANSDIGLAVSEEVLPTETDFSTIIAKIVARNDIQAVVNLLHPIQAGVFVKQAFSRGLTLPQFCLTNFEDAGVRKSADKALLGQWYVSAKYSSDFLMQYHRDYSEASLMGAPYGHDIILLIAESLKAEADGSGVMKYLQTVKDFHGAIEGISADGHNGFKMPVTVKVVGKDGF